MTTQEVGTRPTLLERARRVIDEAGLDGWLVADFRWSNPLFGHLLGLGSGILTRRTFLWVPRSGAGEPRIIISLTDAHTVSNLGLDTARYRSFDEMVALLGAALPRGGRIAMEYVERGALPTVSVVDAGLVELIRSLSVEVASSGALVSALDVWTDRQRALHERAAGIVDGARRFALELARTRLARGERLTEGSLADLILSYFGEHGLTTHAGPDIAAGPHGADPHYAVAPGSPGAEIGPGSVLVLDLWGKVAGEDGAPYADSTWMAFAGSDPPDEVLAIFAAVRDAREAAIFAIDQAACAGHTITGREVDRAGRAAIERAGMSEYLIHRTGHSLGTEHVQGMGTNLDDVEFPDDRPLLPGSGFTVEPGLYLPGRFGVRLEVSAILLPGGVQVTTERQEQLTLLQ
jgi:Xaa-Pro aminopeptidase